MLKEPVHADVALQIDFMNDLRNTTRLALKSTRPGEGLDTADKKNPRAVFDNDIDRVVIQCVNALTPKWFGRLAGFMFTSGISAMPWSKVCVLTRNSH